MGKYSHRKVKKRRYSDKTSRRTKFLAKDILFYCFFCVFFSKFSFNSVWDFCSLWWFPWLWVGVGYVMMLCMRSYRSTRRGNPCPLMKIFLEWVNFTACTVNKLSENNFLFFSVLQNKLASSLFSKIKKKIIVPWFSLFFFHLLNTS